MKQIKSIIAILVLMVSAISTEAQTYRTASFQAVRPNGTIVTRDTTTNTDTSYLWSTRTDFNQWPITSLIFKNTNVSGSTTASIIVQGSNDATTALNGNWYTLKQPTTIAYGASDTATATGTTYTFNLLSCPYRSIRIRIITGGSQTSYMTGTYYSAAPYEAKLN